MEEEKTAPGCGGEQVLSLDSELEYAERYNYDMYEDYALISLKLKNRQRHNRRFRCPFQKCWKLFKESGNLSTHIRSHVRPALPHPDRHPPLPVRIMWPRIHRQGPPRLPPS